MEGCWGQDLGARENSHFLLTSVCTLIPDPLILQARSGGGCGVFSFVVCLGVLWVDVRCHYLISGCLVN